MQRLIRRLFGATQRKRGVRELAAVLAETADMLQRSCESDWAPLTPPQVVFILEREIDSLRNRGVFVNAIELSSLFMPTAEIQEISMANDWSNRYIELSTRFDVAFEQVRQSCPE